MTSSQIVRRSLALVVCTAWIIGVHSPAILSAQEQPEEPAPVEEIEPSQQEQPAAEPQPAPAEDATKIQPADDGMKRYLQIRESARRQIQSGQGSIHIYQLVEEMVDEVIADVRGLNTRVVSPVAIRNIGLSPNLSRQFGDFVEATLVSSMANNTDLVLKRCVACKSLRSRVDGGEWVVALGVTSQEDLRREARRLGVKSFLDARFAYYPGANVIALNAELIRADDGAILWSETYRSDSTTAAILRTGDRVLSREERLKELERKLEARPYYGHMLYVGGSFIPYDSPQGGIGGAAVGYRLYEKFGEDRRFMFGIGAEGFANFGQNALLGSFIGASLWYEIFQPNLNREIWRTGPTVSGFFAGQEGNSFAVQWDLDVTLQFRLGVGISAMYFVPVQYAGNDLGGFGYKARASFNW